MLRYAGVMCVKFVDCVCVCVVGGFALPWLASMRMSSSQTYFVMLRNRSGFRARSWNPFHAYRISCSGMESRHAQCVVSHVCTCSAINVDPST